MSRELLPCPFCGASAKMMKPVESTQGQRDAGYGPRQYGVACGADLKCEAHVSGFPTSATAREAWNTRAPVSVTNDPRVQRLIEAADELVRTGRGMFRLRAALANLEKKE